MRREYLLKVEMNGRIYNRVLIDSHFESKHIGSISDQIIFELVKSLNGRYSLPVKVLPTGFEIHVDDPLFLGDKPYRLVWTVHPKENYVGINNAFRTKLHRNIRR